jgi:tetratricopeptide (TPR) repeat protein
MKALLGRIAGRYFGVKPTAPETKVAASTLTAAQCVEQALVHHGARCLVEAASLYRKALSVDPDHFDALHLLGVVHQQMGDSNSAVELIEHAISLSPENGSAHSNLGLAYRTLNLLDKADACFAKAVQLNPSSSEALNNLGNLRKESGRLADAEECYRKALAVDPAASVIWKNLGQVVQRARRLDEALNCYRKALEHQPDDAMVLTDIGTIHMARSELSEAEHCFRHALQLNGDNVEAMCNLGAVLARLDRFGEAEQSCRRALAARPNDPDTLNNVASVLLQISALDDAEVCCRSALSIRHGQASTQNTMGRILSARGRPAEAEECFRLAMQLAPESSAVRYNLSILALIRGDYGEGFLLYESRFDAMQCNGRFAPATQALLADNRRWHGEPLSGKRLLIWTEQGYGDSLMMLRYLPMLKERGVGEVIVLCERVLERVVGSISGMENGVSCMQTVAADRFDLHCPIMSLPLLFETTLECIPNRVPYIAVPDEMAEAWKGRLASNARIRVGLAWAGSRTLQDDARRSIPLSAFAPILRLPSVQFVSLQKEGGAEEIAGWRGQIENWMDDCEDFMDTAALVRSLDLVITVDSAVAHLAGALGTPVWLLNRFGSEWRWGRVSEHSPWYPSMRIYRQQEGEGWNRVISRVADALVRY